MSSKRRKNIEHALKEKNEIMDMEIQNLYKIVEEQFKTISYTLDRIEDIKQMKKNITATFQDEEIYNENGMDHSELIEILDYKENEYIEIGTDLFPENYHKLEEYGYHCKMKNRIIQSIRSKLLDINLDLNTMEFTNNWTKSTCIFYLKKEGRKADFDNYFMKPYLDGIVLSGFLKNDFMENVELIYRENTDENYLVKIKIIKNNK